jgi:UDP-glucose 4-epimerase
MRVLVTGATGYIGGWLIPALVIAGHDVFAVARVAGANRNDFTWVRADLAKTGWTASLPSRIDVVVHLAQSRSYRDFPGGAPDMLRVNVDATVELLDWSRHSGVRGFVLASSGNVYAPATSARREGDPCRPGDFYGATKLAAEDLAEPFSAFLGLVVPRIFSVYGPGQRAMTVANLIDRVIAGTPVELAAGVGLVFSPLYITDCVSALVRLVEHSTALGCTRWNLAGGDQTDIRAVTNMISEALNIPAVTTERPGPPKVLVGDASAMRSATGWRPLVDVADGIRRTVAARQTAGAGKH